MNENSFTIKHGPQILELFKQVIKFGLMQNVGTPEIIGMLRAFADSLEEGNKPLEWWVEHPKGQN